jgi:hypothetical protein
MVVIFTPQTHRLAGPTVPAAVDCNCRSHNGLRVQAACHVLRLGAIGTAPA